MSANLYVVITTSIRMVVCICTCVFARVKLMIDGYVEVCSMELEADLNETAVARFELNSNLRYYVVAGRRGKEP